MGYRAGVVGAAGFAGIELVRLLSRHPEFDLAAATSDALAGTPIAKAYPAFTGVTDLAFSTHEDTDFSAFDVVFLAVPHKAAMGMAPDLMAAGVTVVDDYAHHPTEVAATIEAAKALSFDRVVVLFQPHRYTRTQTLAKEFAHAFDRADALMVMDVYSAGEDPIEGVSGQTIVDCVNALGDAGKAAYVPSKDETVEAVLDAVRPGDLLITMGAGDITSFGPRIVRALEQR